MQRTTAYARTVLRRIAATPFVALVAACGDGGDLGPLWVETDVRIADIDGDSRADMLTISMATAAKTSWCTATSNAW